MRPFCIFITLFWCAVAEDFPSLISANASIAVVLDHQFLGDQSQPILDELKNHIKELSRVELKHGGVIVHYYAWTAINLKKGFLAVFSVASCQDTWSLYRRVMEEEIFLFALTEVDCPRLPRNTALTVTFAAPGDELPQLLLDLRTERAFNWKSAVILHDNTLNRDVVSRAVQSLTSQTDNQLPSTSVTVYKMRYVLNDYLRRKEINRVLSKLPVQYIGENFVAIVKSEMMLTMVEAARDLGMSHTMAQWLYIITDSRRRHNTTPNELFEGENVAYIYNTTTDSMDCKNGILCYCKELMGAFISALDTAVQDEFDVAAQISDEEWEAIRPSKIQRRDMLLRHMQQYISVYSGCGNCSRWEAMVGDTWGTTYQRQTDIMDDNQDGGNKTNLIEHVELLQVGYWRPVDGIKFQDILFPHVQHGFRGKELPILTYHNPPWTILHTNASGSVVSYSGLLFDIVGQLAKSKNFT
ncbi:ionotropic receptor 93a [Leptidea sinapis]|uniref:ionotropic receptor 93a n=1 Tax=Leptidea sinapis TaxID=189913 RepID=UPI0021C475E1|nr:ionotropic receptor 93a [Leptidea sinapis]